MSTKKEYLILGRPSAEVAGLNSDIPIVRVEQNIKLCCPFCESTDFVRRGTRKKKHEVVQLFQCKNPECKKLLPIARSKVVGIRSKSSSMLSAITI